MKPNFALDLSHDGISLLYRANGRWSLVGEVKLDDPAMGTKLAELRSQAEALADGDFFTKLIIPNSQILYTTLDAPGPDDIAREVQIRGALEGLTPYSVGELVFDWRAEGEQARVAVLARETMDEAEAFAADFGFKPVSFAARPDSGVFSGEPFFGKSTLAAKLLGPTARVMPEASPVPAHPKPLDGAQAQVPGTAAPTAGLPPVPGDAPQDTFEPDAPIEAPVDTAPAAPGVEPEIEDDAPTSAPPAVDMLSAFPPTPNEDGSLPPPPPKPKKPRKPRAKKPSDPAPETPDVSAPQPEATAPTPELPVETPSDTPIEEAPSETPEEPTVTDTPEGQPAPTFAPLDDAPKPFPADDFFSDRPAAPRTGVGFSPISPELPTEEGTAAPEPSKTEAADDTPPPSFASRRRIDPPATTSQDARAEAPEPAAPKAPPAITPRKDISAEKGEPNGFAPNPRVSAALTPEPEDAAKAAEKADSAPKKPKMAALRDAERQRQKMAEALAKPLPKPGEPVEKGPSLGSKLTAGLTGLTGGLLASAKKTRESLSERASAALTRDTDAPPNTADTPRDDAATADATNDEARPGLLARLPFGRKKDAAETDPAPSSAWAAVPRLSADDDASSEAPRLGAAASKDAPPPTAPRLSRDTDESAAPKIDSAAKANASLTDSPGPDKVEETTADKTLGQTPEKTSDKSETSAAIGEGPEPQDGGDDQPKTPLPPPLSAKTDEGGAFATTPPKPEAKPQAKPEQADTPDTETADAPAPGASSTPPDTDDSADSKEPRALPGIAAFSALSKRFTRTENAPDPAPKAEPETEAEALTVFGARKQENVGGKPPYLGLALTLTLLLLMAIVALWSTLFGGEEEARFNPDPAELTAPQNDTAAADPTLPQSDANTAASTTATAPSADLLAAPTSPDSPASPVNPVSPEPDATADSDTETASTTPVDTLDSGAVLSEEAAAARYAATGVWQRAPDALPSPETETGEDLTIAAIDPSLPALSGTELPRVTDPAAPGTAAAPPPAGTTFDLGDNGLVVATRNGALSPDGILVFAGRPATVPPVRPAALAPDTPSEVDETAPVIADPNVPRTRPRARPDGLVADDQAEAQTPANPALAGVRPRSRPAGLETTVAAAPEPEPETPDIAPEVIDAAVESAIEATTPVDPFATATRLATATSPRAKDRPRNMSRLVEEARAAEARAERRQEQAAANNNNSDGSQVIAAANATARPTAPSAASVARSATQKNVLNLSKVSLIGIYGSSSSRRALVRLPSGRFVKVKVGDRLDGGRVTSMTTNRLTYQKGNRSLTLDTPPLS